MREINGIINGLSRNGFISGLAGGVLGGAATSMIGGKKMKKAGGTLLKAGALAAVGGLAWKAYQSYKQTTPTNIAQQDTGNLSRSDFDKVVDPVQNSHGPMLVLKSMIAAAYADGHMDDLERQKIFAQVKHLTLSASDKAALFDAIERPLTIEQIALQVDDVETALEVYTASVLAIDQTQPESTVYLRQLSSRLNMPPELVAQVHQQAA